MLDALILRSYIKTYYDNFVSRAKEYVLENISDFFDEDTDVMRKKIVLFTESAFNIYSRLVSKHIGSSIYLSEGVIGAVGKVATGATAAYVTYNLAKALKDEFDKKISEIERDKLEQKKSIEQMKTEIEKLKRERRDIKYNRQE
ncbi:MAG: hypothetical protein QXD03_02290 [Candidatus Anstonellales archaeon]